MNLKKSRKKKRIDNLLQELAQFEENLKIEAYGKIKNWQNSIIQDETSIVQKENFIVQNKNSKSKLQMMFQEKNTNKNNE